jgi:hydroxymethylbilane synthase
VDTRLKKLQSQQLDAIILAEAGLRRLGFDEAITEILDPTWMLPAVGQGAIGLECREEDKATQSILNPINDAITWAEIQAERAMLAALGGGCLVPVGALSRVTDGRLQLRAAVLSMDGRQRIFGMAEEDLARPLALGASLAGNLIQDGAAELLLR